MSWTINSKTLKASPATTDSILIQEAAGTVKRAVISWFAQSSWFDGSGSALALANFSDIPASQDPLAQVRADYALGSGLRLYIMRSGHANSPSAGQDCRVICFGDAGYCEALAYGLNSKITFRRSCRGGTWEATWTQLTDANGNPMFPAVATTASAANAYIAGSGNTILQSTSSAKYKTDIRDLDDTSTLDALRPVLYKSNPETVPGDDPTLDHYGFIAEDIDKVDPKLVEYKEDEAGEKIPNGVQYDRITVLLVKRIHELEARLAKAGI